MVKHDQKAGEWLTLRELAEYSRLSVSTLRKYLDEIPHTRIGRKIVVRRRDYDRWLSRGSQVSRAVEEFYRQLVNQGLVHDRKG